jgi:glycosyltransferase involved in cell wall biosynthesis
MLSVVFVYYNNGNKNGYLTDVLKGFQRQTVKNFELIIIDNYSPISVFDDVGDVGNKFHFFKSITIVTLRRMGSGFINNVGQCTARNMGTRLATGSRVTWNDGDCVPSKNYVEAHLSSLADVCITAYEGGRMPGTLSCNAGEALDRVSWIEENPRDLTKFLQHPDPNHFLNAVTRGVSLKIGIARCTPFDEDFNYDANDTESGKGWEDIDFGLRLYKASLSFEGNMRAFTIHVEHDVSAPSHNMAVASYKNWVKLNRKHPDLRTLCAEWHKYTENAILSSDPNMIIGG